MNRQPILNLLPTLFISTLLLGASASVLGAQQENRIIRIRPESGTIGKGSRITVYFTEAVVATDAIDRTGQGSPLLFDPEVAGTFLWKSQTEGQFLVSGSLIPGQRYTVQLTPGLKRLDGNPVNRARWIDRFFQSPELTVTTKSRRGKRSLPQQPKISLMFNYGIRFADATRAIYFQDRESRERFASEILLPSLNSRPDPGAKPAPALGSMLFVQPAAPLPAGRTVDIVVDGLRDDATGTPMPHLRSFPLGKTTALEFERAYTLQDALTDPSIVLHFNQRVAVDSVNAASISVQPTVPNLKRLSSGSTVRLEGNFNPEGKYRIEMAKELLGITGYALSGAISENVEFEGITPSIYFPTTQYFTRPALGLKMKFLHANTGAVTWQLGRLPEHKIGIARARLFQDGERLIDQLGIKPVAKGSFPAASGVQAVYRDINWRITNEQAVTNGVYLLEVSAPLHSGKLVANRSIIFFNDLFVTKKKTGDELLAKVQDMSGSKPIANVRVRMVTAKNILLATSTTDADGIARFNRSRIEKQGASHLLIDSPGGGYAAVFVAGPTFRNSGGIRSQDYSSQPVGTIIPDRNLYRPGTSAKFKGFLRHRDNDNLRNAPGQKIDWHVTEGYRGRTIAAGNTITDEFGGWEAEWSIPKGIKLGSYYLHANSCGYTRVQVEE
ncbi:MAG: MG2 domain-containing protein, partial [Verrucomicrobiales bacterium]